MTVIQPLARNTAYSAIAFGISGLVGLALVPIIVKEYGLVVFGLIVLARTLLPSGALGILDFGLSETATQAIGRARGAGNWTQASEHITLLLVIAIGIGTLVGLALLAAAPRLLDFFRIGAEFRESYIVVLRITGIAFFLLFPGLVAEGVIKGFERYGMLRALEVVSTAFYALATVMAVTSDRSYVVVVYAFLAATIARYAIVTVVAVMLGTRADLTLKHWNEETRLEVMRRSFLMFGSKILGSLQYQIPPLLVGVLIGPAGVALYDVVTRLPRFLKATLGLLASAVLPVAARIDSRGDVQGLRLLGGASFWLVPYATFPVIFAMAALARPLLEVWVGIELSMYWPWLIAMLLVPALQICLSVPQMMLLVRPEFIAASNRITATSVILQFAVSVALVEPLGAMSFIFGVAVASIVAWPFHVRLLARTLTLNNREIWRPLGQHTAFAGMGSALLYMLVSPLEHANLAVLLGLIALWVVISWGFAYVLVLEKDGRTQVSRLFLSLLGNVAKPRG